MFTCLYSELFMLTYIDMAPCVYYLRQWPTLWNLHNYFSKHPCLCVLMSVGVTLFVLVAVRPLIHSRVDNKEQVVVDYIADYLDVRLQMVDNFQGNPAPMTITLTNTGSRDILTGRWCIYFNSLHGEVGESLDCGLRLKHVNGGLFYLSPVADVQTNLIPAGKSLVCNARHGIASISRTDHMPNWYVTMASEGIQIKVIKSTASEDLKHIGTFDKPNLWKRNSFDTYNPYTPEERFKLNSRFNDKSDLDRNTVLPTPLQTKTLSNKRMTLGKDWVISESSDFRNEAKFLSEKLKMDIKKGTTNEKRIRFVRASDSKYKDEEYTLNVDSSANSIAIFAGRPAGAFYGTQTLLSLLGDDNSLPSVSIRDRPRFDFRGLMVDVSRNFRSKTSIKKVIDAMSTYKMNKLHLHLSDDEGWRLEIPSIPELTEVGSRRCHSDNKTVCLMSGLGSGPYSTAPGSGYYSVADYRDILLHAASRHVQVIPEIDMPGHAMAAVFSMNFRESVRHRYKGEFKSYLLNDDVSVAKSVQNWAGNSMNPCLNSTYMFITTLIDGLVQLHRGVQDLTLMHIGGDEVPAGAWDNSRMCRELFKHSRVEHGDLKKLFVHTVADIAAQKGLAIGSWEDGMYEGGKGPYRREELKAKAVYINPWNNVWEQGLGGRAYEFADAGYKVILSLGTILYFDHPYEPDPEERGLYWATRYTDTEGVFGFMPGDVFANIDKLSNGQPASKSDICGFRPCPSTKKPENIVGIQACIWGELIRTDEQFHTMLFPRLLAVAERAWHKASWEDVKDISSRDRQKARDLASFVKLLGWKELPRLEKSGISYRLPIPGASFVDDNVHVNAMYPNHKIMYSTEKNARWQEVSNNQFKLPTGAENLYLKTMSKLSGKSSRAISLSSSNRGE